MKKTLATCIFLFVISASPSWSNTTQAENDLLIRQAWRAGQQLIENGMYRRGVEYLEAYVKNRPSSADGWYWLAKGYQGMGMLSKAQKAFTQTLEVDPEYPPLSRVLQNRAIGEAIPLMDPAGEPFRKGLPVIDPGTGIFNDRVIARPAPVDPPAQAAPPVAAPPRPQVNESFSPLGARKVVVSPSSQIPDTNPVVPIPPVADLTGEPEGPGIPMIRIPDGNQEAVALPANEPAYVPPAPSSTEPKAKPEQPVYVPPKPKDN